MPLLSEAVVLSGPGCRVVLCMLCIVSPKIPCAAVQYCCHCAVGYRAFCAVCWVARCFVGAVVLLGGQEQALSAVSHTDMLGLDVVLLLPGAWFVVQCLRSRVP